MALDSKKSGFSFDLEEKFKDVRLRDADASTPTHEYTHEYVQKENRAKRKSLLVRPSVEAKIVAHAERTGTSFNSIVCDLLDKYIEDNGL